MASRDTRELGAIFAGGMLGAVARVWIEQHLLVGATWPWATFAVNVSGTIVLAWSVTRLQERLPQSTYRRPFLGTGFCGAFTTFSTLELELVTLVRSGHAPLAVGYAAGSIAAGYVAMWFTTALARRHP